MLGSSKSEEEKAEEMRQADAERNAAVSRLGGREEDTPHDKTQLLEELSKSDIDIDDQALQYLATKDIPTSNFDEGDVAEFRGFVDLALLKKRARYPHEGQDVTGTLREWVHDDPNAGLDPIDKGDLLSDETFAQAVKARVLKAKRGSLLRSVLSSIRHSIVQRENGQDDSGGRLLSRFK